MRLILQKLIRFDLFAKCIVVILFDFLDFLIASFFFHDSFFRYALLTLRISNYNLLNVIPYKFRRRFDVVEKSTMPVGKQYHCNIDKYYRFGGPRDPQITSSIWTSIITLNNIITIQIKMQPSTY